MKVIFEQLLNVTNVGFRPLLNQLHTQRKHSLICFLVFALTSIFHLDLLNPHPYCSSVIEWCNCHKSKIIKYLVSLVLGNQNCLIFVQLCWPFQGVETMIVRYNSIVTSVKKKGYDLLDHRKGEVWRDRSNATG